jgi:hypothetical protein
VADFFREDLQSSRFEGVDLSGSVFRRFEWRSVPCLLVILNEEWEHRLYAERDLDDLEARTS